MSRSGYTDCDDDGRLAMWRGQVASATRGKRGQKMFRDLLAALDAMPEKALIAGELEADGEVCALGALGRYRGVDMAEIDATDPYDVGRAFDIARQLAAEVAYMNDEHFDYRWTGNMRRDLTPAERWAGMRAWVVKQIREVAS